MTDRVQSDFEEQLHSRFTLPYVTDAGDTASLSLELVEVTDRSDSVCDCFTLLFASDEAFCFDQRTYSLQHDVLGSLELFMVPVAVGSRGCEYEVVINRLKERERA